MQIIEVNNKKLEEDFLLFPVNFYKNDPNYIRPLDDDIKNVFNPKKNKKFRNGEAIRWLLLDEKNEYIGRVSAFVSNEKPSKGKLAVGGMGFFDCIDNQDAANILFDKCKTWLEERGLNAMDGPINFGERNFWWGLLVEGFTPPLYGMNYNPLYYKKLFENYGFKLYFKQFTYGVKVADPRPEVYMKRAATFKDDPNYRFVHIQKKNLKKYAIDFLTVYNKAWGNHPGFKKMTESQAVGLMNSMKDVIVEDLMWFGYYKEEPIAVFLMLPELNQYFKYVNGKMNFIGKLKYLYHKLMGTNKQIFGMVFGVTPEFQGKGVEGGIIMAADKIVQKGNKYEEMQMTWIGDFNPKMMRVAENLGGKITKVHITYRYIFDETIPFEREKIIT
ncbi:MAG: hypothetical protein EA412_06375 [Chitinophagaceae bacterium]|nr:MAG: hypothetical protein EA412_06375 [Chitinophagaceae bacterium]